MKYSNARSKSKVNSHHNTPSRANQYHEQPFDKGFKAASSAVNLSERKREPQPMEDFGWLGWVEKARDFE